VAGTFVGGLQRPALPEGEGDTSLFCSLAQFLCLVQASTLEANTQQWKIEATADGYYRIPNRNKALDVNSGSTADRANVNQWTYNGGNNQQWQLSQLSTAAARASFGEAAAAPIKPFTG
jgi:hypothetical protein